MVNPDLDEGAKLLWMLSQVPDEGAAGLLNILITGGPSWIAGREGGDYLELIARASGGQRDVQADAG